MTATPEPVPAPADEPNPRRYVDTTAYGDPEDTGIGCFYCGRWYGCDPNCH